MGLTYNIRFKRKLEQKQELTDLIKVQDNSLFLISKLYDSTFGSVNGDFDGELIDLEFAGASFISFDVIKKYAGSVLLRKSVLQMVHKITNEIYPKEDYYLIFNGDYIFEKRENGIVKRNGNSDFYDGLD
ncbi:hypothetical protein [Chryseobacterium sp. JV274]|uniref:hypothetical protein n=1 Tax=unclassified Chryseobacterium TaxID=2593645 RepID=UPI0015C1F25F|nr:hypothetical protein [Chryseobacterium sp. JV274]CAD0225793.1 conserved protein of unknown function [Chryseobacterium sp. JV274]